jgi:hypothetical protein
MGVIIAPTTKYHYLHFYLYFWLKADHFFAVGFSAFCPQSADDGSRSMANGLLPRNQKPKTRNYYLVIFSD